MILLPLMRNIKHKKFGGIHPIRGNLKTKLVFISLFILLMGSFSVGSTSNINLNVAPTEITLGGLFPLTGSLSGGGVEREAAFRMAIEEINSDSSILPNTTLNYLVRDTATDPTTGATVGQELLDLGVFGLVGAASSSVSKAVALKAEVAKKPQISYSSSDDGLSDKNTYPFFMRMITPNSDIGRSLAKMLFELNITTVATISSSFSWGRQNDVSFQETFRSMGGIITTSQQFNDGAVDVKPQLQAIVDSNAKVIVLQAGVEEARTVFRQAADVGITAANGFQWVGNDVTAQDLIFGSDTLMRDAMQGMIGATVNLGEGPVFDGFLDLWDTCNGQTPSQYAGCGDRSPNTYAVFTYDVVYSFAIAAHNLIEAGQDSSDGDLLLAELLGLSFDGATGRVSFRVNGDREGVHNLLNLIGTSFVDIGNWHKFSGLILTNSLSWASNFTPGTVVVTQIETTIETITLEETETKVTTETKSVNAGETTTVTEVETTEIHIIETTTETTGTATVDFPFSLIFIIVGIFTFRKKIKR